MVIDWVNCFWWYMYMKVIYLLFWSINVYRYSNCFVCGIIDVDIVVKCVVISDF